MLRRGLRVGLNPAGDFRGLYLLCPNPHVEDLADEADALIQRRDARVAERLDLAEMIAAGGMMPVRATLTV